MTMVVDINYILFKGARCLVKKKATEDLLNLDNL
jgi:hypothetical protein